MGKTFSTGLLTNGIWQDASNNIGIGGSPSGSYKLEVTGTSNFTSPIRVSAATGFAVGSIAGYRRMEYVSTTFSLLTDADGYAGLNAAGGTFSTRVKIGGAADDADISLNVSAPSGEGKFIMFGRNSSNTAVMAISSAGALSLSGSGTTGVDLSNSTFSYSIDIGNNQFIRQKNNAGTLCLLLGMSSDNSVYLRGSQHIVLQPAGGTTVMTAFNSGNVSIGTGDIGYKLNLNGQPGANGYTLWTNYSDLRLKENITDLEAINVLDKICAIRPVTYNYNELSGFDKATRSRRISGFIAQELMEVFPDMVGTIKKGDEEYYDTNLSNLTLYLVKAIQEQQAQIQDLQEQNQDLKSRLDKAGL